MVDVFSIKLLGVRGLDPAFFFEVVEVLIDVSEGTAFRVLCAVPVIIPWHDGDKLIYVRQEWESSH
jgi:hypothetical protein